MKSINIYKEQTMTSLKVNGRKFALVEYQDMATMECGLTVKQQEELVPIIAHSWAMK